MTITGTELHGHDRASIVCDAAGSLLTVRIRGEIDHHTAIGIRRGIDALIAERRPGRLMLDLSAVSFMDSSGLGLIMGRLALLRELGGELVVWNPSPETCRILTLAGMERMVRIEYPAGNAGASDTPAPSPSSTSRRRRATAGAAAGTRRTPARPIKRKEKDA